MSTTDNTASASPELEATKTPAQPKRTNSIDMLHGPLLGKLIIFAVPLALSSIISQLFNSADAVVAGRFINSGALAAVGGVAPVISLLIGLFVGLSVGANVAIAIRIGHGRMDLVKNAVQTTAVLTLVCGALLTVVGMLITGPILDAIGMPAEATEEAAWYLRIYFAGSVFFLAYNFGSAVLRAKGDTRRPLYALAAAMLLNVVLNVIAVTVFNAGVIGIAIATDISNALSAAIVIRMLLHEEDAFRLEPRHLAVDRKALKMILYIGLPSGLQSMVFSFSNVIIQAAINSFGADSTAGSAATMNYEYYTYFFVSAFSQAAVTFIGQNFAAGNLKRCDSIVRICMAAAVLSALTLSAIFVGLGNISLGAFTTEAGALWLDPAKTTPYAFYQYWRNVDDSDVLKCIKMLTFLPLDEIEKMESWEGSQLNRAKEILAFELTQMVHGAEEARKAQEAARALFGSGANSENMPTTEITAADLTDGTINILDLMQKAGLIASKGEGRRLVQQGGVSVDDVKVTDIAKTCTAADFEKGHVIIKKGKKVFHKVVLK